MKLQWIAAVIFATAGCQSVKSESVGEMFGPNNVAGHASFLTPAPSTAVVEPVKPAAEIVVVEDEVVPVFVEDIGTMTRCGKIIIAMSENAVGDPCETTAGFMASLGLSSRQIAYVERRGKIPEMAH
jgi:hypothetical protein